MKRRDLLKRAGIGLAAVAGSELLAACGSAASPAATSSAGASGAAASAAASAAATAASLPAIRISNTPANQSPTDFMTLVANSQGLYKKYGVDGQIVDGTTKSVPPLFLSGKIDVLLHGSALFTQALQGQKVTIIAGLGSASPFALIAKPSIGSVAELKGKVFGVQAQTGSIYQMALYQLKKAGLTPKDVSFRVIAGYPNLTQALMAGGVDAALVRWADAFEATTKSSAHLLTDDPASGFDLIGYRFAGVHTAFADQQPAAVQGFVTALIQATRMLAKDQSLYTSQVKALLPSVSAAEAAYTYKLQEKVGFWSVNGGMDPAGLERNLDFYRGVIAKTGASPAPVSAIADTRFVKAALDTLGGPIASTTDAASWYKK